MKWHDVQQNTEEWEDLRLGKATASNFSKFMAKESGAFADPAKRYALKLALERLTGRRAEFSFRNDDMDRGHELEPLARMLYEEMTFTTVTNGGFFDCGEYGDSPDGLVDDDGVIEIKSVTAAVHYDNIRRGDFDPTYRWQLAGHLDCSGRQWVDFISYCPEFPDEQSLVIYRVTRADFTDELARLADRRHEFLDLVRKTKAHISQLAFIA